MRSARPAAEAVPVSSKVATTNVPARRSRRIISLSVRQEEPRDGGQEAGQWNGKDPSPDGPSRHPPAHGGEAPRGAHADNGARDGMRGADGDAAHRGADQHERARGLRAEATHWTKLGDPHPHRLHNTPAARHGPEADRRVSGENHPDWHVELGAEIA